MEKAWIRASYEEAPPSIPTNVSVHIEVYQVSIIKWYIQGETYSPLAGVGYADERVCYVS